MTQSVCVRDIAVTCIQQSLNCKHNLNIEVLAQLLDYDVHIVHIQHTVKYKPFIHDDSKELKEK